MVGDLFMWRTSRYRLYEDEVVDPSLSAIIGYFADFVDRTASIAQTWTGRFVQAMVDMVVDQRALCLRYGLLHRVELAGDVDLPPRS
jgi:hypothetical protein